MFKLLEQGPDSKKSPHHFNFALKFFKDNFCPAFKAVMRKRLAGIYIAPLTSSAK